MIKPIYDSNKIVNFCIVDVNHELLLAINKTREQVIGLNILEIFPIASKIDFFPKFVESFETRTNYFHEYEIPEREDRPYGAYRVEVYPLDGSLAIININLTKQKVADQQIIELHFERERVKLLQGYIRDSGHDIRTPLTVIGTSIYLAEKEETLDKAKERLATVKSQVKHIIAIVEELVRLTHWKNDPTYSNMKVMHINPLVAKIAADMQIIAASKNQIVSMRLSGDFTALIDEEKMYRAITNIIKNAITYTNEGGLITVATEQDGDHVKVVISDTGIGIEESKLDLIFAKDYRVDYNRIGEDGNSGLGLTIAREIIESHAGNITVQSKVGVGSSFIIMLPCFADIM